MAQCSSVVGQLSSTGKVPWPEVQSLEQFQDRFQKVFGSYCIFHEEAEWLDAVTKKFGTAEDNIIYWTEADVHCFLALTLSEDIQTLLHTATPLIYRCLCRLGSFPYFDQAAALPTLAHMRVALAFLVQRHLQIGRPVGITGRNAYSSEAQSHGMRTLLFRGMRLDVATSSKDEKEDMRTEADDNHMLQAHYFISALNHRRSPNWPTFIQMGPPIIKPEDLPTFNSADYSGVIPRTQLVSLLRISRTLGGEEVGALNADPFLGSEAQDIGVSWEEFNAVYGASERSILHGLGVLLKPFISQTMPIEKIDGERKP